MQEGSFPARSVSESGRRASVRWRATRCVAPLKTGVSVLALGLAVLSSGFLLRSLCENISGFELLRNSALVKTAGLSVADARNRAGVALIWSHLAACRPTLDEAAAVVSLADLMTHDQVADYDGWSAAASLALAALKHELGCAPTDGVAWARLAIAERLVSASPNRLAALLTESFRLAPADPSALISRVAVVRSLPTSQLPDVAAIRRADIATVLGQAWPEEVASLYRAPEPALAEEIEAVLATMPAARQQHLRAAGLLARPDKATDDGSTLGDQLSRFLNEPSPFQDASPRINP